MRRAAPIAVACIVAALLAATAVAGATREKKGWARLSKSDKAAVLIVLNENSRLLDCSQISRADYAAADPGVRLDTASAASSAIGKRTVQDAAVGVVGDAENVLENIVPQEGFPPLIDLPTASRLWLADTSAFVLKYAPKRWRGVACHAPEGYSSVKPNGRARPN